MIENLCKSTYKGIYKGNDPISTFLATDGWNDIDSCWLYFYTDTLRKIAQLNDYYDDNGLIYPDRKSIFAIWRAPLREMSDSINHFYNYNSWEDWLEDDGYTGVIQFTIYESDFIGKK